MNRLEVARRFAGILAAVAVLGCAPQPSAALGPAQRQSAHGDWARSWMLPEAKSEDLLYVSDAVVNNVYVYAYPDGKLVGTLSGFQQPEGDCADKAGNVFVANYDAENILEYAHGGTRPIATLTDAYYYPEDCSSDPTSGNLAVTNASTVSEYPGNVVVYANAKGIPTQYYDTILSYYRFCGYDNEGNLFIDGQGFTRHSNYVALVELPNGSSNISRVKLNHRLASPGGVQWNGKALAVGDAGEKVIYRFAISGLVGTKTGETPLEASPAAAEFWIQGRMVVVPNPHNGRKHQGTVQFYKYPVGGVPIKTIGLIDPDGATVSLSNRHP
jgi:hypothetical protein